MIDVQAAPTPTDPDALARLKTELDAFRTRNRPDLVRSVQRAKAFLDTKASLDAVSIAEHDLALLDQKIALLEQQIKTVEDAVGEPAPPTVVTGYPVTIRLDEGMSETITIVTPSEASLQNGFISIESPAGKALLGKRPGERVTIDTGGQSVVISVEKIGAASDAISE